MLVTYFSLCVVVFGVNANPARPLSDDENHERGQGCGRYKATYDKILYGKKVEHFDKAPFAVAIRIDGPNGASMCSGTMISSRHVITAAHCFKQGLPCQEQHVDWKVTVIAKILGALSYETDADAGPKMASKIYIPNYYYEKVYCEKSRDTTSQMEDVAIIELVEDMPFENDLWFACLAKDKLKPGKAQLFGYGIDVDKNLEESSGILKGMSGIVTTSGCRLFVDGRFACFKNPETRQYACNADSGAGISYIRRGKTYINGLLICSSTLCKEARRRHINGDKTPFENGIVDLSHHLEWICQASGICVNRDLREKFERNQRLPEDQRSKDFVELFESS